VPRQTSAIGYLTSREHGRNSEEISGGWRGLLGGGIPDKQHRKTRREDQRITLRTMLERGRKKQNSWGGVVEIGKIATQNAANGMGPRGGSERNLGKSSHLGRERKNSISLGKAAIRSRLAAVGKRGKSKITESRGGTIGEEGETNILTRQKGARQGGLVNTEVVRWHPLAICGSQAWDKS